MDSDKILAFDDIDKFEDEIDDNEDNLEPSEEEDTHTFSIRKNDIESLFKNLTENPVGMENKDFLLTLSTLYQIFEDEFEGTFEAPINVLRNTNFYLYFEGDKPFAFVYPGNNFNFWLKSKGSLYRFAQKEKEIKVNGQIVTETGYCIPQTILWEYFSSFSDVETKDDATFSFNALNTITQFILKAVQKLYFIPKIELSDNLFSLKYELFSFSDELVEPLAQLHSIDFDSFSGIPNTLEFLLDSYLNYIMFNFLHLKLSKFKDLKAAPYFTKYFKQKRFFRSKDVGKSIADWLDEIYIGKYKIRPVIVVKAEMPDKFTLSVFIKNYAKPADEMLPVEKLFTEQEKVFDLPYDYVAMICEKQLNYALKAYPALEELFEEDKNFKLDLNVNDVYHLMAQTAYYLNKAGIDVILPQDFGNIVVPRASINVRVKADREKDLEELFSSKDALGDAHEIFNFDYKISVGDEKLTPEEFAYLVQGKTGLVAYKNMYILADEAEVKKLLNATKSDLLNGLTKPELLHAALSGTLKDCEFDYDEAFANVLKDLTKPNEVEVPKSLHGTLRPYQENGLRWLYTNITKGFGACIADDMGLGKTIQVISLILKLKEENRLKSPVAVVCPTTLLGNWVKELQTFAPSLKASVYHGAERKLDLKADVIITTFSVLRIDIEEFKKSFSPSLLVVDEAQNIKNPDTSQTLAVKALKADMKIAVTGTPVENRLAELWSIFDFINKGYLGSASEFQKRYAVPIEKFKQTSRAEKLKLSISPFVLRRLKTDKSVISDLPEKIVIDEYCYLTKSQAALYEKTLKSCMEQISGTQGINRRGMIFKLITALKQICNHPYQYVKSGEMTRDASGKCDKFISILNDIVANDEKTVVFTQYKEMGKILVPVIAKELNTDPLFFHGSLNVKQRDEILRDFSENPERKVMILSLKAGGTGLNLTNATNVIHYDLWWNPAVEDQATDRIYRIGQKHNVMVHRMITLGTFEEKIDEMIKKKKELVDMAVYQGEKTITDLTDEEIYDIFTLSA
ncbi:MAG: DEAD/DEAH box helicase [Candidatus Gastranaerophilaceae bacterium]